ERHRVTKEIVGLVQARLARETSQRLAQSEDDARLLDDVVGRRIDPRSAADKIYEDHRKPVRRARRK
ncbi:MAG: hypothetical protein L3K05_07275, partial [Thermoplasmata archaeon]|nr:hypothetical protein [Thermoplasmata archaeon]